MYADDLVEWMMEILSNANPMCPVFNVGSDQAVTLPELAHKVGNYFGVEVKAAEITTKEIDRYVPSIQKARNLLGVKLSVDLNRAIELSVSSDV
jgi:nucleoside-diphosphate-sugar epimerase